MLRWLLQTLTLNHPSRSPCSHFLQISKPLLRGKPVHPEYRDDYVFFLSFSKCMNTENYYFFPPQNTQYGLQNNYFYSLRICKKLYLCCYWNSYPCVAVFLCLTLLYCFIGTLRIIPGSDSKKTQRPPLIFREKRHGLLRFKSHVFLPDIAYLPHFVCINTSQQPTLRERSDQSITTAESSRSWWLS